MSLRGHGTVVFISSDAAVEAYPTWGAYGISKAAGAHLMRIWAEEVPTVRFLAIDPGEMDTAMHAAAIPDADPTTLQRPVDVARRIALEVTP
jgi:NAD(P)-dependent dehydrogenase (short-subunit alcohol dehydrogenase family)